MTASRDTQIAPRHEAIRPTIHAPEKEKRYSLNIEFTETTI